MGGHLARTHARRTRVILCAVVEEGEAWGAVADLYAPCEEDEEGEGEWGWRRVEGASVMALQPLVAIWKARYELQFSDVATLVSEGVPRLGGNGEVPVCSENRASRH